MRLQEGRGALLLPESGPLSRRTIELWLKVEQKPATDAIVWAYAAKEQASMSLRLRPDGTRSEEHTSELQSQR